MERVYRIAVFGSTGKGDFGHGLDRAFVGLKRARLVALADEDEKGRKRAGERLQIERLYADYRELLTKEKPDVVCIGQRWLTDREAMVNAAAKAGCHIYCEKPLAADLTSADSMQIACSKAGVKLALAHQWRPMPPVRKASADLKADKIWIEDWHFTPEHQPRPVRQQWLHLGNQVLATDLLDAVEEKREPLSPLRHGVLITEMVQGVYASHFADGRRLPIPLTDRKHPLRD